MCAVGATGPTAEDGTGAAGTGCGLGREEQEHIPTQSPNAARPYANRFIAAR